MENRLVSFDEANHLAEQLGISYFEVSARTGQGIDDLFSSLTKDIVQIPLEDFFLDTSTLSLPQSLVDSDDDQEHIHSTSCC